MYKENSNLERVSCRTNRLVLISVENNNNNIRQLIFFSFSDLLQEETPNDATNDGQEYENKYTRHDEHPNFHAMKSKPNPEYWIFLAEISSIRVLVADQESLDYSQFFTEYTTISWGDFS